MSFYEEEKHFSPVFRTALSLMQTRGHEHYCQLIQQAEISVVNTDFDNWNGGTYGYTVYLSLPVKVYATSRIFIMEFKYEANGKDRSREALQQIKDNRYAEAYYIKGKEIEGVGISFSKETRNVSAFVTERLYTPQVYPFMKG